jgi:hypothetical protein
MDIEKSQPARSGIALIPTRIVNMFTDEKMFSPLPENETSEKAKYHLGRCVWEHARRRFSIVDNSAIAEAFPFTMELWGGLRNSKDFKELMSMLGLRALAHCQSIMTESLR